MFSDYGVRQQKGTALFEMTQILPERIPQAERQGYHHPVIIGKQIPIGEMGDPETEIEVLILSRKDPHAHLIIKSKFFTGVQTIHFYLRNKRRARN